MSATSEPNPSLACGVCCMSYREVQVGDDKCRQARARHGLPPLQLFGP
jgi:hypothetical protein